MTTLFVLYSFVMLQFNFMQNGFISRLIKGESLSRVLFIRVTCVYNNSVVAIAIPEVLTITGCATAVGQNDLGDGSSLSFMRLKPTLSLAL